MKTNEYLRKKVNEYNIIDYTKNINIEGIDYELDELGETLDDDGLYLILYSSQEEISKNINIHKVFHVKIESIEDVNFYFDKIYLN